MSENGTQKLPTLVGITIENRDALIRILSGLGVQCNQAVSLLAQAPIIPLKAVDQPITDAPRKAGRPRKAVAPTE